MIAYIHAHKDRYGVEPICQVLPIAPSTYHAANHQPASARAVRDGELKTEIARIHAEHFGVSLSWSLPPCSGCQRPQSRRRR